MNPYSYIMNNPLAGTDPSGYVSQSLGKSDSCANFHCMTGNLLSGFTTATSNGQEKSYSFEPHLDSMKNLLSKKYDDFVYDNFHSKLIKTEVVVHEGLPDLSDNETGSTKNKSPSGTAIKADGARRGSIKELKRKLTEEEKKLFAENL